VDMATNSYLLLCLSHIPVSNFVSDMPKPYRSKKGVDDKALRYVAKQPLKFEQGDYNIRKLMRLPFHLTGCRELAALKKECLCNYQFLLAKLSAVGYRAVREDFKFARATFPEDQDLHIVMETLQLSQDALTANPGDLAGQLVGRIHGTGSQSLLQQAKDMLNAGTLPPEALPVLNLLETFEVFHQKKNKVLYNMIIHSH